MIYGNNDAYNLGIRIMPHMVTQYSFLGKFTCLGQECPDTCCWEWDMETDKTRLDLYANKAPELLPYVNSETQIMKRDHNSDCCTMLEGGLCHIQKNYPNEFLGDGCHFYPRIIRQLDHEPVMTANISCPEIARLILLGDRPFTLEQTSMMRMPLTDKPLPAAIDYVRPTISWFMELAGNDSLSPEQIIMEIITISQSLSSYEQTDWPSYLSKLSIPSDVENHLSIPKATDPYCIFYALGLLVCSAPKTKRARLHQTIAAMEAALGCKMIWETREISLGKNGTLPYNTIRQRWTIAAEKQLAPLLKRWIQSQLAIASFPFGGYKISLRERSIMLAIYYATVRLALMCHIAEDGTPPDQDTTIRIIQSLARFLGHLASSDLSMTIYKDAGWLDTGRLRGVVAGY